MTVFSAVESTTRESRANHQKTEQQTEHPISKSVREHLKTLLDKPLTVKSAREVRKLIDSTMTLLMAFEGVDGHLENRRQPTGLGGYNSITPMPVGGWVEPVIDGDAPMGAVGGVSLSPNSPLPIVPSSAAENFGTTAIRELIGAFAASKASSKEPTLSDLMESYTMAKNVGSDDLATLFKKKIKTFLGEQDAVDGVVAAVAAAAVSNMERSVETEID